MWYTKSRMGDDMKDYKKAAKEFSERWKDKGYEKGQSQKFWIDLLSSVYGVENPVTFIEFEDSVHIDKRTGFIDAYIPSTRVLIEQKSIDKDLSKAIKQADGSLLNPFQQAKKYIMELPVDKHPRWVITCNFKSFRIYDMNNPNGEPEEILLKDLPREYYRLMILVDSKSDHIKKEEELSFKAGELVGKLYDAFSKQYNDLTNEQSQKDLNELCVRLVFCLYAEDAGLFGRKNVFHDYLAKYEDLNLMRQNLLKLFKILDTPLNKRDPYIEDDLNQFPYVNGGLFSNEDIEIPSFTEEIRETLLAKASDGFDWSEISPTIFGAVFESTLNQETRRSGGMHYTSIENIHKVIDPLFLNDIRDKLDIALNYKNQKTRYDKLVEFQKYIGSLVFLDPACGSGNFLTETYLSLRRLENEALAAMGQDNFAFAYDGDEKIINVSIQQFYGIEINDFAVKVAKTALWIAEAQMWNETRNIISSIGKMEDFLPLEAYENIVEGNALTLDWNDIVPNSKCNYIMGNPPFVGARMMNPIQKNDVFRIFDGVKNNGNLDYVACWYKVASNYINKSTRVALVSTNSICQGEQASILWPELFKNGIVINFTHKTFIWDSEASLKAHVHCIIVGFSKNETGIKYIFDKNRFHKANNINAYLVDAPNVFIHSRSLPICDIPKLCTGCQRLDDDNFMFTKDEMESFIKSEPLSKQYFKRWYGAEEFINNKERYCLYLGACEPFELRRMPKVLDILNKVREYRLNSNREQTRKCANTPHKFYLEVIPKSKYLLIPVVSSERRRYIPIGFMDNSVLCSNQANMVPNASLYHFGIITSNVHMSWMRAVAGRLKSDYRYSKDIVYNNFPWPNPSKEQKEKIEQTAQMILVARDKYKNSSLADLYDELTMPSDLRKAHQLNDIAVMQAYGFNWRKMSESECVAELIKLYEKLIKNKSN